MAIIRQRAPPFQHQHGSGYMYRIRAAFPGCNEKWVSKMIATTLLLVVVVVILSVFQPFHSEIHVVLIDSKNPPIHKTDKRFLSVALDSSLISEHFNGLNLSDPMLVTLMKPLAGGYLRIGGTMADRLIFKPNSDFVFYHNRLNSMPDGGKCAYEEIFCAPLDNFTMTGRQWLQLNELSRLAGMKILFDLNCLLRNDDDTWNSANAEELIDFSATHNLDVIWQLGNEPNSFRHVFNYYLSAAQLGDDFIALKKILMKYPIYADAMLVGPDVTRPRKTEVNEYLKDFLYSCNGVIDAVTWHQYYFRGADAQMYYFLNPDIFNFLQDQIDMIKVDTKSVGYDNKPLWLSETSSAYGGGAPGLSDRFISTFIWMDKLGLSAKNGLSVVIRQSFYKGFYALVGETLDPRPDWWLSILYKKLVGQKVVECFTAAPSEIRMYCHCAVDEQYSTVPSLVIYGMNMRNSDAVIRFQEDDFDAQTTYEIRAYVLQTHISLVSKLVYMNEQLLTLINGTVPEFIPIIKTGNMIKMPAYSLGFWVIKSPSLLVCK